MIRNRAGGSYLKLATNSHRTGTNSLLRSITFKLYFYSHGGTPPQTTVFNSPNTTSSASAPLLASSTRGGRCLVQRGHLIYIQTSSVKREKWDGTRITRITRIDADNKISVGIRQISVIRVLFQLSIKNQNYPSHISNELVRTGTNSLLQGIAFKLYFNSYNGNPPTQQLYSTPQHNIQRIRTPADQQHQGGGSISSDTDLKL
jgi:hypothetical protein